MREQTNEIEYVQIFSQLLFIKLFWKFHYLNIFLEFINKTREDRLNFIALIKCSTKTVLKPKSLKKLTYPIWFHKWSMDIIPLFLRMDKLAQAKRTPWRVTSIIRTKKDFMFPRLKMTNKILDSSKDALNSLSRLWKKQKPPNLQND